MKKRGNFAAVKAGLEANNTGRLEERERLRTINNAIMTTLPEAVRPWAKKLMFDTKMTAAEIVAAARCAPGGGADSSMDNANLGALGRETAAILLGKVEDPNPINFAPMEPNVFIPDMDSDLAKKGAETARALKAAGFLGTNLSGPGRMA